MAEATIFDAREVTVTVDGEVITGFTDGTFVECEKNGDGVSVDVGAQGEVTFVEDTDPTGQIKITLRTVSPSNASLQALSLKAGAEAVVAASVEVKNTGERVSGAECRVTKPANLSLGREQTDREWTILVADYTHEPGSKR